jgi:hypothetical protein
MKGHNMTDYILHNRREIDRLHLSDMHQKKHGTPTLEIKLYYHKDARRRGLKLSVSRCLVGGGFSSYDLMNRHNGLIHLADMDRKPSPKLAAQWEKTVTEKLDQIAEIALESAAPDWRKAADLFATVLE